MGTENGQTSPPLVANPEAVINRLAMQNGSLQAQLAVRDDIIEQLEARIAELEKTKEPVG